MSLQQPSGVFAGDTFGEIDTRFLYIAVNALSLLDRLDAMDVEKAVSYIRQCRNFDGGYGAIAGAESHSAQGERRLITPCASYKLFIARRSFILVFVCVAALAILDRLDEVDSEMLSWWLSERQLPHGGLNGRPEKLADVSGASRLLFDVQGVDGYGHQIGLLFVLGAVNIVDPQ